MNRRYWLVFAITSCLLYTGCITPSAVDDLAKASTKAAGMFPSVASIPYDTCVMNEKNRQLGSVTTFDGTFAFNQTAIDAACKGASDTMQRLEKTYAVLTAYITALDKLAGGNVPTYDTNIKGLVATIPGLNSTQQTAVTSLSSLIADLVDKGYRKRQASKAIEQAQPWVHELCGMLADQLTPYIALYISNQRDSLRGLYRDISAFRVEGSVQHTSPVLVAKDYIQDRTQIDNVQAAAEAFQKIIGSIGEGHTSLYNNRNKLWDKKTIQALFQPVANIEQQSAAVEKAFTTTSGTSAKKVSQ